MKTPFILSALLGFSLVSFNLSATAGEDDHNGSTNGCSAQFNGKFCLQPTADAPAGAKGKAVIETESEDGVQTGTIEGKVKGLPDGTYTLSVFLGSSSNTVDIGQITVSSSNFNNGDDGDNEDDNQDSLQKSKDNGDDQGDNNDDQGEDDQGDNNHQDEATSFQFTLTSDIDPMDIIQVIVSDSNGTQMLVGDLSDSHGGCKATLNADAPVNPGDAAPQAAGTAHLNSKVRKGKVNNRFTMTANNVPPSSTFTVEVNGTEVGKAKSNKKGKVLLKKLPKNLSNLDKVRLLDSNGNEVAHANF